MRDYIHAARVFLHGIRKGFGFRESLWWVRRSMIGPDDWPVS